MLDSKFTTLSLSRFHCFTLYVIIDWFWHHKKVEIQKEIKLRK